MPSNPKLVETAIDTIARITGAPADGSSAATRLRWTLQDGSAREPILATEQRRNKAPHLGEVAWVHAYGDLRRGLVVKTTPRKCLVAYVVPSNTTEIKVANVDHHRALLDGPRKATR